MAQSIVTPRLSVKMGDLNSKVLSEETLKESKGGGGAGYKVEWRTLLKEIILLPLKLEL